MSTRYAAYHEEMGVYLGEFLGLGFWTLLDPAGLPVAVTFKNPAEIRDYFTRAKDPLPDIHAVPVQASIQGAYATVQDCIQAGLPGWCPGESPVGEA
jgi:hypothetical protein